MRRHARFSARPGFVVCRHCGGTGIAPSVEDEANSDAFLERLKQRLTEIGERITIDTSDEAVAAGLAARGWTCIPPTSLAAPVVVAAPWP